MKKPAPFSDAVEKVLTLVEKLSHGNAELAVDILDCAHTLLKMQLSPADRPASFEPRPPMRVSGSAAPGQRGGGKTHG